MRLDKLLANTGYGSRKDVKTLVKKKKVIVNDKAVKDSSCQVNPQKDNVMVNGERVHYREYIYLMMNKPPGHVSATEDLRDKTVVDLLSDSYKLFNPFPVGRLDKDTEGLLLITNDGDLAHQLTSPKKDIAKTYYVEVSGSITNEDIDNFQNGVVLEDGYKAKPAQLNILQANDTSQAEITVTEGKFHQVKRMFQARGKKVTFLKRIRMGTLRLDGELANGKYRELTHDEVENLKSPV